MGIEAFATREDMVAKFGENEIAGLEDPDNTGTPSSTFTQGALTDATEYLMSMLAVRYSFPLPNVPSPLRNFTCDYARWLLYSTKPTDEVTYRAEKATEWAKRVSEAKAELVFDVPLTPEEKTELVNIGARMGNTTTGVFGDSILDRMVNVDRMGYGVF